MPEIIKELTVKAPLSETEFAWVMEAKVLRTKRTVKARTRAAEMWAKGIGASATAVPCAISHSLHNASSVYVNPPINSDAIMQALKFKRLLHYN